MNTADSIHVLVHVDGTGCGFEPEEGLEYAGPPVRGPPGAVDGLRS